MLLAAAIAAPFLGAALYRWLHGRAGIARAVDIVLLFGVPIIVGWHVLDHLVAESGWAVLPALAAGAGLPWGIERLWRSMASRVDDISLLAGLSGLALHVVVESTALSSAGGLGLAVVLHRAPVGFVIWWMIRPRYGTGKAVAALTLIAVGTLTGYLAADAFEGHLGLEGGLFQAFVGGSLLHVLLHQVRRDHRHEG